MASRSLAEIYVWEDERGSHAVTDPREVPPAVLEKYGKVQGDGAPAGKDSASASSSAPASSTAPAAAGDTAAVIAREKFQAAVPYLKAKPPHRDLKKAIELLAASATRGNADGQFYLGAINYLGLAGPRNVAEAFRWFKQAADQGNPGGQCGLALLYESGEGGVVRDPSEAIRLYRLAGEQQPARELKPYAQIIRYSVLRYYTLTAERGRVSSQLYLGSFLLLCQRYEDAYRYLHLAADQGDGRAQRLLGLMFLKGSGMERNPREAAAWFQLSARQNDPLAQRNLAVLYRTGVGVARSPQDAFRWYLAAAENGDLDSFPEVAFMYLEGTGTGKDTTLGLKWIHRAADYGYDHAQVWLGISNSRGRYMERNDVEGLKWLTIAAAKGNATAARLKGEMESTLNSVEVEEAAALAAQWVVLPKPPAGREAELREEADLGLNLAESPETIALLQETVPPLDLYGPGPAPSPKLQSRPAVPTGRASVDGRR
ncbi:SEL1-like repeat protein [Geomonas sp. Red32]|nr:SEL1-like repeat protein [Geomonas sp. Red32]